MGSHVVDGSARGNLVDRYKLLFRLQILAVIGCLLVLLYSGRFWTSGESLRIFAVGILVGGAALTSGFLLGFIFGIPRVVTEKVTEKATTGTGGALVAVDTDVQSNAVTPNSNLVEISDWLTKIMVGVGLVELNRIPAKLGKLSYYIGPGLRPTQCDIRIFCSDAVDSAQTAALAIIIFYFTLGFLWGYIWTRLYFQRDLGGLVERLQRTLKVTDLILKADASIKEGQLDEAMEAINQALKNNPQDGRAMLTKARILKRQANLAEKLESENLLNQAIVYADQAITLLPGKGEPIYNKACYQALLGFGKSEILSNLRSAFRLNPALRRLAADDHDLDSLRQDADFNRLMDDNRLPDS